MIRACVCLRDVGWYHSFPRRVGLCLPVSVQCIGLELSFVTHCQCSSTSVTVSRNVVAHAMHLVETRSWYPKAQTT
jgi:hypothetical protein